MTRKLLLAVAAAVAAAVPLAVALGPSSDAATGPAQIRVTSEEVVYERVDVGRKGRSAGDMEIFKQLVYNRRITRRALGHAEFVCTFTIGPSRSCRGTIFLPKGKLVVGGPIYYRQLYQLAILGGTGLYDNARGTMTGTLYRRPPRRAEILQFKLVG